MSHGGELDETCHFGHIIEADGGDSNLHKSIKKGEIETLEDLEDEEDYGFGDLFGEWKQLKIKAGSQGTALAAILTAADDLDTGLDYDMSKIEEGLFVSPQSQMHAQFMERKNQAENNIKQTMQSYQQLIKQKHMLQHDIRKLRSRVEAINSREETVLKGDFIELVDGAGQSPRQGGDQMSLKAYRDQSIYPSIVADFNEMESVDDLKTAEQKAREHDDKDKDDFEDGVLADLPENEKAILKKKYKMYEQWKDLYGSEIERKLNDLKGQMKNIERSIDETEEWLEPYVRDANMINKMGDDQMSHDALINFRGNSTQIRSLQYLGFKAMKLEDGELTFTDKEDATHFRIMHIKGVHANLASFSQPQTPADGTSVGRVFWKPGFVCRHVFEEIIEPKIDEFENEVQRVMEDYKGEFSTDDGETLKEARNEEELSVRELREKIDEEMSETIPLELSSMIRRVEDGLGSISDIKEEYEYGEEIIEQIDEILDTEFSKDENKEDNDIYNGFKKKYKIFFGKTDDFYMEDPSDGFKSYTSDLKDYYYDYKGAFGMHTMK